jgi:prolipoprotein diacylglyceryltransferase
MYPTLYHFFNDAFGVEWHWAKLLNSFGFFVALAFITASYTLSLELKRREGLGQFKSEKRKLIIGKSPDWSDIAINGFMGFIFGWKIVYLLVNSSRLFNGDEPAQAHLFSSAGYPLLGILVGGAFAFSRWWNYRKKQLPVPEEKIIDFHVVEYTGTITFYAAIFGLIGAKLFHLFENPKEFVAFSCGTYCIRRAYSRSSRRNLVCLEKAHEHPLCSGFHCARTHARLWNRPHRLSRKRRRRLGN